MKIIHPYLWQFQKTKQFLDDTYFPKRNVGEMQLHPVGPIKNREQNKKFGHKRNKIEKP